MEIRSRLGLISGQINADHSGHQTSDVPFIRSIPLLNREFRFWTSDRGDWFAVGVEGLIALQHAPSDAGELVGESDGELEAVHASGPLVRATRQSRIGAKAFCATRRMFGRSAASAIASASL
jgi:hypothetical protein